MSVESQVLRTIRRESLLPAGPVVVAVSGGADSVALLLVLHALRQDLGLDLHVAHLDHALRSGSAADAEVVAAISARLGVPVTTERINWSEVPPPANLEEFLRNIRYDFLLRVSGGSPVAVGHHADDRLETFLAQLVRGAGPTGLSHPRYRRADGVVRPLLDVAREELRAYVRERGFPWREDPTNHDGSNLRSRLRAEVLPALRRENPAVAAAVGRTTRILGEVDALLDRLAAEAIADLTVRRSAGELVLAGPQAQNYDALVRKAVVRSAVRALGGDPSAVSHDQLEEIVAAWTEGRPVAIQIPGSIEVGAEGAHLRLAKEAVAVANESALPVPGELDLAGSGAYLRVEEASPPADAGTASSGQVAWVDADSVVGSLRVRPRRAGDRYRPLGLGGSAKVQDLFVDRRIPRAWREFVPMIVDGAGILWIPGFRVDQRSRITEETHRALRFELRGEAPWMVTRR